MKSEHSTCGTIREADESVGRFKARSSAAVVRDSWFSARQHMQGPHARRQHQPRRGRFILAISSLHCSSFM